MFTWDAEVVEKYLSSLKEGGRWSTSNRKAKLPDENSFPLREDLLWRESPEIPTGLFLTSRAGRWDGAGRDRRETASPRPRRKRPQGKASGKLTNGHPPDRGLGQQGGGEVVPGGGAEEKAHSPELSPLPSSPAQAAGPGPAQPPGQGSLHPHPSPSFPPPLTEPEPAAMRRGFRPGAERKTREPPRTGTASTTPEELFRGCGGGGGGARGQRAELRTERNACAVWLGLRRQGNHLRL